MEPPYNNSAHLRKAVCLLELRDRIGSHIVSHLPPSSLWPSSPATEDHTTPAMNQTSGHKPSVVPYYKTLMSRNTHLYHWKYMNEIQPLDLMRLLAMRALHFGQNKHNLLCGSAAKRYTSSSNISYTGPATSLTVNKIMLYVSYLHFLSNS